MQGGTAFHAPLWAPAPVLPGPYSFPPSATTPAARLPAQRVCVFMCAPPSTDLDVLPELRAIIRTGCVPETRDLYPCGSVEDLRTSLIERRPSVLHYGGHGNAQLGA